MRRFEVDKLVRDKIVERIIQNPLNRVEFEELSGELKIYSLVKKINEEAAELISEDLKTLKSELVDIQSAINALIIDMGISKEEFEVLVKEKDEKAGTFEKGLYLKRVDLDDNDQWVAYYEDNFKEIKNN